MPRHGGGGAETPQSPLRITHDGEFYARLLTKESSQGNPSFRYYGAGPGAVPFVWESHPGTPKDPSSSSSSSATSSAVVVPAITPPPSYSYHLRASASSGSRRHYRSGSNNNNNNNKATGSCRCRRLNIRWIKIGFFATVFRRLAFIGNSSKPATATAAGTARSSASSSVKSSSSTRWLFSGGAAEGEEQPRDDLQDYCCYYDYSKKPPNSNKGTMLCLGVRPTPSWMVHFWGGSGGGRREPVPAGWV